jgi:S-adenosylmethionine hydrolase
MKMTEHTDKVELQKEKILKESLDQQVTAIDIRFGRIQTRYASGKVVTEYPRLN